MRATLLALAALLSAGAASAPVAFSQGLPAPPPEAAQGRPIYVERCAQCHDKAEGRVPSRFALLMRPPEAIVRALSGGVMRQQGEGLTQEQIKAVAAFITLRLPDPAGDPDPQANRCAGAPPSLDLNGPMWNGWGRDLDNSRFQPAPGIRAEDVPRLRLKWAFAFPGGTAYGAPSLAGGRLFLTTASGVVLSLDARTGCTHWAFQAEAPVRTAVSVARDGGGGYGAWFGDEQGGLYGVDARTGTLRWRTQLDEHPLARIMGAPVFHAGRVYVGLSSQEEAAGIAPHYPCCTFRGSLSALDAQTGRVIWKTHTIAESPRPTRVTPTGVQLSGPAGAAVWSSPTIDAGRGLIFVGTGNSYTDVPAPESDAIIAFDLKTGQRRWVRQVTPGDNSIPSCPKGQPNCPSPAGPDVDFGAPPILRALPAAGHMLLAGQKSGVVYGMDPATGEVRWQTRLGQGGPLGGIEYGMAADRDALYVAIADSEARPPHVPGGLTALDIATGKQIWHTPAPPAACAWGTQDCQGGQRAAVTAIPGAVFSGSMDGHLRAYASGNGALLWEFDTARDYQPVNHPVGRGGSVNGHAQIVADSTLYVLSGAGVLSHPGNVLLAFTVDGR